MSLSQALQSRSTKHEDPFLYWLIDQPFSEQAIREVVQTDIPNVRRDYDGTRAGDATTKVGTVNTRCFISPSNVDDYPALGALVDDLLSPGTIELCSDMLRRRMDGYLRVEVICDREGFWLEPHKDIKEKLMSMLLYVNLVGESENLGTDLYDGKLNLVKTVPFRNNFGYMFAPSHDTWHGLEKKTVQKERRSVLINYVTFQTDWQLPLRRAAA